MYEAGREDERAYQLGLRPAARRARPHPHLRRIIGWALIAGGGAGLWMLAATTTRGTPATYMTGPRPVAIHRLRPGPAVTVTDAAAPVATARPGRHAALAVPSSRPLPAASPPPLVPRTPGPPGPPSPPSASPSPSPSPTRSGDVRVPKACVHNPWLAICLEQGGGSGG